jgi:hypothetical protein
MFLLLVVGMVIATSLDLFMPAPAEPVNKKNQIKKW